MPHTKLEAITFDVGGTLIHPWPSVGHIYAKTAAEAGYGEFEPLDLNRRFNSAWRKRGEFGHSYKAWSDLVDRTFAGLVSTPPSETFFPVLYGAFTGADAWKVYDDVVPTLEELASRGVPLAIISNWDERLRPLLRALKLSSYFQTMLISSELYFTKPSNVIFDHALRSLGVPAESVLHVGDSVVEDVEGAKGSGLQAVLIDRLGTRDAGRITSLNDILELI